MLPNDTFRSRKFEYSPPGIKMLVRQARSPNPYLASRARKALSRAGHTTRIRGWNAKYEKVSELVQLVREEGLSINAAARMMAMPRSTAGDWLRHYEAGRLPYGPQVAEIPFSGGTPKRRLETERWSRSTFSTFQNPSVWGWGGGTGTQAGAAHPPHTVMRN